MIWVKTSTKHAIVNPYVLRIVKTPQSFYYNSEYVRVPWSFYYSEYIRVTRSCDYSEYIRVS